MEIELNEKFNASIHVQSIQQKIQEVKQTDFQRKLFLTISVGHVLHIFDTCMVMFVYNDPITLLLYFICYASSQLIALTKQYNRNQQYCTIIQLILLCWLYFDIQPRILFIIKSFINGYMNQILQMLKGQLVQASLNVGYLITIIFSIMALLCDIYSFSHLKCLCCIEVCVLLVFIKHCSRLPPLMENCIENNECDIYIKYIQKCIDDNSILNYEEYKNSSEHVSIIQTYQATIHKPSMKKFITKLSKFNEQIYKYFVWQTINGFLFYGNLTYIKYLGGTYIDIIILSLFGSFSKPLNQFQLSLYSQKQVYWFQQFMCFIAQLMKSSQLYRVSHMTLLSGSIIWSLFHCNHKILIESDYRTLILGVGQVCRHLGGIFLAYSVYDYLSEQLWAFLYIQMVLAQIGYALVNVKKIQF